MAKFLNTRTGSQYSNKKWTLGNTSDRMQNYLGRMGQLKNHGKQATRRASFMRNENKWTDKRNKKHVGQPKATRLEKTKAP